MSHPHDALHAEIAALRKRVEELEAELAYVNERFAVPDAEYLAALALGIPRWAMGPLHLFLTQSMVTTAGLVAIAEDMDWRSAEKFPSFAVHRLRKHLRPKGIKIETEWGLGYSISPENQARLQALMHYH